MAKEKPSTTTMPAAAPAPENRGEAVPKIPSKAMYLGPSILENGQMFQNGRIFNNGLPLPWLDKAISDPEFRHLLVPLDRVAKAVAELKNPQSMLSMASRKVLENAKARKNETKEN